MEINNLKKLIQCEYCHIPFNHEKHKPHILACSHTICSTYITKKYQAGRNTIKCPKCEKVHKYKSINKIMKNVTINDKVNDFIKLTICEYCHLSLDLDQHQYFILICEHTICSTYISKKDLISENNFFNCPSCQKFTYIRLKLPKGKVLQKTKAKAKKYTMEKKESKQEIIPKPQLQKLLLIRSVQASCCQLNDEKFNKVIKNPKDKILQKEKDKVRNYPNKLRKYTKKNINSEQLLMKSLVQALNIPKSEIKKHVKDKKSTKGNKKSKQRKKQRKISKPRQQVILLKNSITVSKKNIKSKQLLMKPLAQALNISKGKIKKQVKDKVKKHIKSNKKSESEQRKISISQQQKILKKKLVKET